MFLKVLKEHKMVFFYMRALTLSLSVTDLMAQQAVSIPAAQPGVPMSL